MQPNRRVWCVAGLLGVLLAGALPISRVSAAAVKDTIAEIVFPSRPFSATLSVPVNIPGSRAVGPSSGTLGVTSLIVTNFLPTPQRINIFQPVMSVNAADCGGPVAGSNGPGSIFMVLNLEANQTLSLPFPTPLVFSPVQGHSCIAITSAPAAVDVYVTGFVN